jgi:hypothetical protein
MDLANKIMGETYLAPQYFRFGASSLLQNVLDSLD